MTVVTTYYCDECGIPFRYKNQVVTYGIHHYCFNCAKANIGKMLTEAISRIGRIDFSHEPKDPRYYTGDVETVQAIYEATKNIVMALDEYEEAEE